MSEVMASYDSLADLTANRSLTQIRLNLLDTDSIPGREFRVLEKRQIDFGVSLHVALPLENLIFW
jgi:hypothetical protein